MKRSELLQQLAQHIVYIEQSHPVRVAIDGVDAAGKTTLADELAPLIKAHGRTIIRASIDGFHNPAHIRHRRGDASPEGYYRDSFNDASLIEFLLKPLGAGGSLQYAPAVFDYRTDRAVRGSNKTAEPDAVLLFDGVFLLRPELLENCDLTIFIEADFEVTLARAIERDLSLFGNTEAVKRRYEQRYIPGQQLYLAECQPQARADIVIDNNDPSNPALFIRSDSDLR